MNPYETDELVAQYMAFHYGESYFSVENYPAKCASLCLQLMNGAKKGKALDLGCAVGRTTFELAREFKQVVGLDLSSRFIESATELREEGSLQYKMTTEGELVTSCRADLAELDLEHVKSRVSFYQEDACNLAAHHKDYDLIFAGNLIDRLQNPEQFLSSIHNYLSVDGILVMSSPYTLLTEYTPRENWLGGYMEKGREIRMLDGIKKALAPHFVMLNEPVDVPFVIRETNRKFQHTLAELSSWKYVN
jgi:putative 4-mercaptohistidine N1-methyltranferase